MREERGTVLVPGHVGGSVEAIRNRNAQRSVRLLEEALTLLIAEKPYDKITVSDITRRADLNRGTFYAHFDSVDQLMRQTMEDLTEKVSASIDPLVTNAFFQDPMPFLRQISDFVCDNLALTRKLVDNDRLGPFLGALMDRIERLLYARGPWYRHGVSRRCGAGVMASIVAWRRVLLGSDKS